MASPYTPTQLVNGIKSGSEEALLPVVTWDAGLTSFVDSTTDLPISGGGGGAVDSVNGQTGVVVLDADDIDDTTTTQKFVTSADLTKLSNLSGVNTGDQTITLTGDVTGSGTGSFAATLNVNTVAKGFTGATSFTAGALIFGNGTSALNTDATKLFWDNTNDGLAINSNTLPATTDKLYVNGNSVFGNVRVINSGSSFEIRNRTNNGSATYSTTDISSGTSGALNFITGNGTSGNVTTGDMQFFVGAATGTGNGGLFYAGAGSATGTGIGGDMIMQPGFGTTNGSLQLWDSSSNTVLQVGPTDNDLLFGTYTAGVLAQTGYITIKDLGGTTRRLLVG